MSQDPFVDEVRAIRDAIAQEHNYDLDSIFRMLRSREATSENRHVTLPPRLCEPERPAETEDVGHKGTAPNGRANGSEHT